MKKNLLCLAVLAASFSSVAIAADYDDRWYLSGTAGMNLQDSDRQTQNTGEFGIGFGRFFDSRWSLDMGVYTANAQFDANRNLNFSQWGAAADLRYHFREEGRAWWPYVKAGVGVQRAEEEFNAFPNPSSPGQREDEFLTVDFGAGLQAAYDTVDMRFEAGIRSAFDDTSIAAPGTDYFSDGYVKLSVLVPLGARAAPPPPPAPPAPPIVAASCETLDDDGDGVNNCLDRCPDSQAGQAIGPDGCAVPLTIDLKGVNFDFDRATLRSDAVSILNEAVGILRQYPQLRVEVAGHTDLCGSDVYNQGLSDRRARTVYDFLTSNGVDGGRLVGPIGYGESRPLEQTDGAFPACRSEVNRRTELNVQN